MARREFCQRTKAAVARKRAEEASQSRSVQRRGWEEAMQMIEAQRARARKLNARPLRKLQRESGLEGQPASHLDDALRTRRRGDLAKVGRGETASGIRETHHIEYIGGFTAELELYSTLELRGVKETQVNISEPWPIKAVASYVAVRAAGADAAHDTGSIGCVCRLVEPLTQLTAGGAHPATVSDVGADARNVVRSLIVGAVQALVRAGGHRVRAAAMQVDKRRYLPAVGHFLDEPVAAAEVVDIPHGGDDCVTANVGIHGAILFAEAAADGAQRIVGRGEGCAKVA